MKELNTLLTAFAESQHNGKSSFLATVVKVEGSTYRQPGAKMLITSTGNLVGTISGGCLEKDILEHTRVSLPEGKPIVVTYDTTTDEDVLWGFGLGCNGVIQVLIEPLHPDHSLNPLVFMGRCFHTRQPGIVATVVAVEGAANVQVGQRLTLDPQGRANTDLTDNYWTATLLKEARLNLQHQNSSFHQYQLAQGKVDVFLELIKPPPHLIIFGAGRDVIPVAEFAQALGWRLTIVDCRADGVTKERFVKADKVILTRREMIHQHINISVDDDPMVVVMTHNYLDDLAILKVLMPSNIRYLGCLGSRQRITRLLRDLGAEGREYTPAQQQKLHAPVGLNIGADTPEAIALSIIAEIQAVLANCDGGFLKHRRKPIYQFIR